MPIRPRRSKPAYPTRWCAAQQPDAFFGALYPVFFRGEALLAAHKGPEAANPILAQAKAQAAHLP